MNVGENWDIIMPLIVSPDGGTPIVTIFNAPGFVSLINTKDLRAMPATLQDAINHQVNLEISLPGYPRKSYYQIILKV